MQPVAQPPRVPFTAPPPVPPTREYHPKPSVPPALVAVGAAVGIVALLAILYLFVLPKKSAETAQTATPAPPQNARQEGTSQAPHPLAKHLEVTGVRVAEAKEGKARIQFLVVNHSSADLPELQMNIAMRAGDRQVFAFATKLPSIGPYEFKELSEWVPTELKPYEIPDWQLVRPQFQLSNLP